MVRCEMCGMEVPMGSNGRCFVGHTLPGVTASLRAVAEPDSNPNGTSFPLYTMPSAAVPLAAISAAPVSGAQLNQPAVVAPPAITAALNEVLAETVGVSAGVVSPGLAAGSGLSAPRPLGTPPGTPTASPQLLNANRVDVPVPLPQSAPPLTNPAPLLTQAPPLSQAAPLLSSPGVAAQPVALGSSVSVMTQPRPSMQQTPTQGSAALNLVDPVTDAVEPAPVSGRDLFAVPVSTSKGRVDKRLLIVLAAMLFVALGFFGFKALMPSAPAPTLHSNIVTTSVHRA